MRLLPLGLLHRSPSASRPVIDRALHDAAVVVSPLRAGPRSVAERARPESGGPFPGRSRESRSSSLRRPASTPAVEPSRSTGCVRGPTCSQAPEGLEPVESWVQCRLGRFSRGRRLPQPNQDFVSGQAVVPDCRHDGGERLGRHGSHHVDAVSHCQIVPVKLDTSGPLPKLNSGSLSRYRRPSGPMPVTKTIHSVVRTWLTSNSTCAWPIYI